MRKATQQASRAQALQRTIMNIEQDQKDDDRGTHQHGRKQQSPEAQAHRNQQKKAKQAGEERDEWSTSLSQQQGGELKNRQQTIKGQSCGVELPKTCAARQTRSGRSGCIY